MKSQVTAESREVRLSSKEELRDVLQSAFSVQYYPTMLHRIEPREDGTLVWDGLEMPHTDHVWDQLFRTAQIPMQLDDDMPFADSAETFSRRKIQKTTALTLCVSNGCVVGIAPQNYQHGSAKAGAVKSIDLLDELKPNEERWEFDSATVSDLGIKINLLIPGAELEPLEGDLIHTGLELTNSETGGHSAKVAMYVLRLLCANGLTHKTDQTTVNFTKLGRMSYSSKLRSFGKRLNGAAAAAEHAAKLLYQDIAEAPLLDTDFVATHRTLRRRLGGSHNIDEILQVPPEIRIGISNRVLQRNRHEPPAVVQLSAWDLHNAITGWGREQRLPQRRTAEEVGGRVLSNAQAARQQLFSVN